MARPRSSPRWDEADGEQTRRQKQEWAVVMTRGSNSQTALAVPRHRRPLELFKATWRRLRGGKVSPVRLSLSIAVGVFIGCQPIYGLHLLVCVLLCVPLRLDAVVAYLGANVSNPFFAPALVTLELEVGSLLLTGEHLNHTFTRVEDMFVSTLLLQAVVGSLAVGLGLGGVLGAVTFAAFSWLGSGNSRRSSAIARVRTRYRKAGIKDRMYVALKLRSDPVVDELCALGGPLGDVLDVGCGRGQFTILLDELGMTRSALGIDRDQRKISIARSAASEGFTFVVGDAMKTPWPVRDTVLLMDVLHYVSKGEQRALLGKAAEAVRPGGRLLVRELDRSSSLSSLGRSSERVAVSTGYNQGRKLEFISRQELVSELSDLGFTCEVRATRRAPLFLPNVLVVATRD